MTTGAIKEIVLAAGEFLKNREAAGHITVKGASDYVTDADKMVQRYIADALQKIYPDIQFLGEEDSGAGVDLSGSVWVLDPVDGTTNLIHDYRRSSISLALLENREANLGIVYQPYTEEFYIAEKGKGAFLNGKRIHVSGAATMEESLFAVGTSPYDKEKLGKDNFQSIYRVFMDSQDIRRTGSAAIDMAETAAGRIEGFFERNLKIWDYAAGKLLVEEAGGRVSKFDGSEIHADQKSDIVCGNPAIHDILVKRYLGVS